MSSTSEVTFSSPADASRVEVWVALHSTPFSMFAIAPYQTIKVKQEPTGVKVTFDRSSTDVAPSCEWLDSVTTYRLRGKVTLHLAVHCVTTVFALFKFSGDPGCKLILQDPDGGKYTKRF